MYTTYVPSMCVKILSQYICIVNSRVCQYIRDATVDIVRYISTFFMYDRS